MARVKDLWFSEVKDPSDPTGERKVKQKTKRHPERGGNPKAKRWLAVWIGSDGKEATKAFAKKVDADNHSTTQEADVLRRTYIDPKDAKITVEAWCATWLMGYATRRPATVRQAKVHVAKIKEEFGKVPLGAVRPSHVKSWTSKLSEQDGLADSYVYALHARLSQIMSDAVHDGLIMRSPCSRRTSPGPAKQRPYVATTEQLWALYDAVPERYRIAILLGGLVGLRVSEACGLRVGDVDFMRGIIYPRVQYPAEELKTETSRTPIPIPQTLAAELSAQVAEYRGEWLLTDEDGEQLGPWKLERMMRKARAKVRADALEEAEEEAKRTGGKAKVSGLLPAVFRFQDLRHYLASLLIASGADVKTVQARMRHASAKTTLDTYAHLWPDRDESTRAAVEAVLTARTEQGRNAEEAR
jgi:integrase